MRVLRGRAKNPFVAEQIFANSRKADITSQHKGMIDFGVEVAALPRRWMKRMWTRCKSKPGILIFFCSHPCG